MTEHETTPDYLPVFFAIENIRHIQVAAMIYLSQMGIDPGVMAHGPTTQPDEIYVLVEDELLESGIATEMTD